VKTSSEHIESLNLGCTQFLSKKLVRRFDCHDGVVRILEVDSTGNQVGKGWKESILLVKVSAQFKGKAEKREEMRILIALQIKRKSQSLFLRRRIEGTQQQI